MRVERLLDPITMVDMSTVRSWAVRFTEGKRFYWMCLEMSPPPWSPKQTLMSNVRKRPRKYRMLSSVVEPS